MKKLKVVKKNHLIDSAQSGKIVLKEGEVSEKNYPRAALFCVAFWPCRHGIENSALVLQKPSRKFLIRPFGHVFPADESPDEVC